MQTASTSASEARAPRRRSRVKHRAILDAAAALVAEQGYHAVTMEQVAARAGVGKQTLYRWWSSKPALYLEVYCDLVPETSLERADVPVAQALEQHLNSVFVCYRDTPAARVLCGLIGDAQKEPETHAVLRHGLVAGRGRHLVAFFERAGEHGELPADFDAEWASDTIVALVWRHLLCEPSPPSWLFARRLVAMVLAPQPEARP